ncbi:hypothetical protein BOW53_16015 [Solemya pervernicosa gill symbiont]|uniref:Uncharacterized protein n=2 Tax=Gammaproteobacteria incertae sedis TaxID=118884 RepID=A0A1T2KZZ5_9GAMM|nr:HD domain-containing phosphohydrolase [Candidatus Reidiella endopervernicosa]OOZ38296.1 hypothetical protein BOW53_16015 [Solemya pervernicosa gill symbiont]QKQ26005.1 HD domain-containing protein [Candidatus Reidiella endopervernicosa]
MLFLLASGAVGLTVYELELRKHDYVILNLAGQLRSITRNITNETLHYQRHGEKSSMMNSVDAEYFHSSIKRQLDLYTKIVTSLRNRLLEPELTGRSDPLYCSWDEASLKQLDMTADAWQQFRGGLEGVFAQPEATIEQAVIYLQQNEKPLIDISTQLSQRLQEMMEGKLSLVILFNQVMLVAALIVVSVLLTLLYYSFSRPLRMTVAGFERVSQGDFGHQIEVGSENELGRMAGTFNALSGRLNSIFRLTDRINQATSVDESLRFVFEEFNVLIPLDWVGMMVLSPDGQHFELQRLYTDGETTLCEGDTFQATGSLLAKAMGSKEPLHIPVLAETSAANPSAEFADRLDRDGRQSALFYPLSTEGSWGAVIAFAYSEPDAYNADHLELLSNIAAQISHSFEKNLVISAITGLARLAENRDPETGDHLVRMALYSAKVAEELGSEGPYQSEISADYVRDLHRFAPMHDIGKVGIEDGILLKPGRLDAEERTEMERHPVIGGEVLRGCEAQMCAVGHSMFKIGIEIAEGHHERFDGQGYPNGVAGETIPLSARIVAVADVFDALTSRRPYKDAWSVERALSVIDEESGQHFDPEVVKALHRAMPKVMAIYDELKHV